MSGLAKILAADGFNVAGSDLERKSVTQDMEDMGIKVLYWTSRRKCER